MEGPINLSFSTLAAMTLDGMIGWKVPSAKAPLLPKSNCTDLSRAAIPQTTSMNHNYGTARRGQDTNCFIENFCDCVLPYLRPFPEPCSVIVLDNSSLHHDDLGTLEWLVEQRGGRLHFLPPYSPRLMPIEMAFGGVLRFLRNHSDDLEYLEEGQYYRLLDDAFRSIDAAAAGGYVKHMYTELALVHAPGPAL